MSPRPKLILHTGSAPFRNPLTGLYGDVIYAPPTDDYRTCPHPRLALRFDPRDGVPTRMYCRACGRGNLDPWLHVTDEERQRARGRAAEVMRKLGLDNDYRGSCTDE